MLSNNLVLTSYLSSIYSESWFFWLRGERRKHRRKKENRQKKIIEKWRERKRKNTRKVKEQQYISLVINYNLLENIIWKKVVYTIKFYLQFLYVAGYLKHSNDAPYLNIHKCTNYKRTEIYINRLSTATQIFIAMDHFIMISEKYLYFRKGKKISKNIFTHP